MISAKTTYVLGITLAGIAFHFNAVAQGVGIGISQPNSSAVLDVSSSTKGFLPPRMTQAEREAINPAPLAAGLLIFNTDTKQLNLWNGTIWVAINSNFQAPGGFQNQSGPYTRTYDVSTTGKTYTVPTTVNFIQVQATGASGSAPNGGYGAQVTAILKVIPGEILTITIGQQGAAASSMSSQIDGGGQASDLRRATSRGTTNDINISRNALLVAGGGGGGGDTGSGGYAGGIGGNGGGILAGGSVGNYGNADGSGPAGEPFTSGGSGGASGAGGHGGGPGNAGQNTPVNNGNHAGGKGGGGGGIGSAGGAASPAFAGGTFGGSGGGGYLSGGDGGGGGTRSGSGVSAGGGGGGGGSSWISPVVVAPGSPAPVFGVAENFGNGHLTITPVQ